ncbi:MAG: PIN domain-containing protein [Hydrogenophilales bacterium CG17_big_fil_post_rev_8_21_14_2_50_63_12]|nr:MAG: PIN domain-containing protein [Hydrogenophilales bacterium CG17_big_fil_post_rev_8_21_14_2_50_63_12]PIX95776.1 MAG: PIN domain-containing protein [Hydrogenophilales bacterium CG_4_10_14_3_um_filter_63_21]PJB07321.1 MAG: PIN domain-containing protein [Hydrogenophilales bacterium CG_4_9_14_3_um_filter_63_34]
MTLAVVDASVAMKWFLRLRDNEQGVDRALALLFGIDNARIQMIQPAHFIAEVAAVLAREKPRNAHDDLLDLINIECRTLDTPDVLATALDLAIRYQHHLFDTLYHAVALHTPGATLITADRRYYEKAKAEGQISLLADWERETP